MIRRKREGPTALVVFHESASITISRIAPRHPSGKVLKATVLTRSLTQVMSYFPAFDAVRLQDGGRKVSPFATVCGGLPAESYARELLEAVPAAVFATDAVGRIVFYNQAAVDLWGIRPELGKTEWTGAWRLYRLDDTPLPHDQAPMAIALKEKRSVGNIEIIAERPDGTRVNLIPHPTLLYDASGSVTGRGELVRGCHRPRARGRICAAACRNRGILS